MPAESHAPAESSASCPRCGNDLSDGKSQYCCRKCGKLFEDPKRMVSPHDEHEQLTAMRGLRPLCITAFVMLLVAFGLLYSRVTDDVGFGFGVMCLSALLGAMGILVTFGYLISALREFQYPDKRWEIPWGRFFLAALVNLIFASIPVAAVLLPFLASTRCRN